LADFKFSIKIVNGTVNLAVTLKFGINFALAVFLLVSITIQCQKWYFVSVARI